MLPPDRVILRGPNWRGDFVMALPALAAARRAWPRAALTLLCHRRTAELAAAAPVDHLLTLDPSRHHGLTGALRLGRALRRNRYDLGILFPRSFSSALVFRVAGIPRVVGCRSDGRALLLHGGVRSGSGPRHRTDEYLSLVHHTAGCATGEDGLPSLPVPDSNLVQARRLLKQHGLPGDPPFILVAVGSEAPSRRWPPERVAECVALLLREYPAAIVLCGTTADQATARQVCAACPSSRVLDLAGLTSLMDLAALAALARAVVATDTGTAHVAAAVGAPTVVLFGAGDATQTAPRGPRVHVVDNHVWCSPCVRNACPHDLECLWSITAPQVHAALSTVQERGGAGVVAPRRAP